MRIKRLPYLEYMAQYPDDKFDYMSLYKDLGFVSAQSRIDPTIYILRPVTVTPLERREAVRMHDKNTLAFNQIKNSSMPYAPQPVRDASVNEELFWRLMKESMK